VRVRASDELPGVLQKLLIEGVEAEAVRLELPMTTQRQWRMAAMVVGVKEWQRWLLPVR
jgi:hypothetical protein